MSGELLGSDLEGNAATAREQVCRWLQTRVPESIPQAAFAGDPFDLDYPGHHAGAVRLVEDGLDYWSAKFDHPDRDLPGRSWMVETSVAQTAEQALFGLRLSCLTLGSAPDPEKSTPGIVRQIVRSCGLGEAGVPFSPGGLVVGEDLAFDQFVALLLSPKRFSPIFAISTEGSSNSRKGVALDVVALGRACLGLAHVVVVPSSEAFRLTNTFGREFSVFHGAVRTYQPGFDSELDSPTRHPLAMAHTVKQGAPSGQGSFIDFLVERAYAISSRPEGADKRLPSFSSVKRIFSERKRAAAPDGEIDSELIALYEDEIESRKVENEDLRTDAVEYDRIASSYRDEAESAKRKAHWLKVENDRLRNLAEDSGIPTEFEMPGSLDELNGWAERHLVGRVELHSRAIRTLKNSQYEDVELVYKALRVLAKEYRDMKMAEEGGGQDIFLKAVSGLGLEYGPSINRTRAPEEGDTYFVEWQGNRRFLENHLKKGTSKDERYTLRIYFFWDEEQNVIVVGSLPGHLETRAT